MNSEATGNAIVKLSVAMDGVLACGPQTRKEVFAGAAAGMAQLLAGLERKRLCGELSETVGAANADFASRANVYMRALKTYPAVSDEWMEVFWAFYNMFDRWVAGTAWHEKIRSTRASLEMDRLRRNPYLTLKLSD